MGTRASGWASTSIPKRKTRAVRCAAAGCSGGSSTRSRHGSMTLRSAKRSLERTRSARTRSSTRHSAASSSTAFIGVDVGTTGVKTIAISPDGEVIARAEQGYPLSTPRPGWSEQDPEDWWRATQATLEMIAAAGGRDVRGIGLSGQMHRLVCLDAGDAVLRPAMLWNDQRTSAECAEIEARIGLERLIQLTGNRALTGFTAPKLLWLRAHEPEVHARIRHVLLPKDYVRLRLTGEHAIDAADASGTLLFDVRGRRWSDEGGAPLDVPLAWLPPVHESTEIAGAGDQAAGALGVGIVSPGPVSV